VALRPSQAGAAASVRRAAYVARLNGHSRGLPAARSLRRTRTDADQPARESAPARTTTIAARRGLALRAAPPAGVAG